jgi:hypothetical protein
LNAVSRLWNLPTRKPVDIEWLNRVFYMSTGAVYTSDSRNGRTNSVVIKTLPFNDVKEAPAVPAGFIYIEVRLRMFHKYDAYYTAVLRIKRRSFRGLVLVGNKRGRMLVQNRDYLQGEPRLLLQTANPAL